MKLDMVKEINLKVDAKYFGSWGCTEVFKEGKNIIYWSFVEKETYHNYLYNFSCLNCLGYVVKSVTSDKHGSLISSFKTMNLGKNIPHQYCLVHIQRRCQTLLTKNPETGAGKDLLRIVLYINQIKTIKEKEVFIKWLNIYETRHQDFISQRTYSTESNSSKKWWYTHKNVRKAFRHLKSSIPNMFHYLDDERIPKDTNGLEAEFTHLKTKMNRHRGLTNNRKRNMVDWYWYLKSIYSKNTDQIPTRNVN